MCKRAVVLAGGRGTRLRPYTVVLPKPLMPIGDYPILEIIIRQLSYFRFDRITLAVNHQADIIKAYFGDGSKWNVHIDYSLETTPLGTIGPLKLIPDLPEHFLLLNGDVLTDLDIGEFFCKHVGEQRMFTIASSKRTHIVDYGVLEADSSARLTGFQEKPALNYLVSMGIYAVNRSVLDLVKPGETFGFDGLMLAMLAQKRKVHVEPYDGYWLDIGRVDDYMRAIDDFAGLRAKLMHDEA